LIVDIRLDAEVVRVAELVRGDQPRSKGAVSVEGLAHRHRRRTQLPVAHREIVGDRVAGDHLVRPLDRDVAAARADDDGQLALVVEQIRDMRHVDIVAWPYYAGDLLVEED